MIQRNQGGDPTGFLPFEPSKMPSLMQWFCALATGKDERRSRRRTERFVTLWISEAIHQIRIDAKAVSHVTDHHGLVHGPRIVADDKPLHSHAVGSDSTIVCRERMVAVHGFALGKDSVLPSVPERILTLKMENEVGLLADFLAVVVLYFAPPSDRAKELSVEAFHGSAI